jgi:hypothetical protein
MAPNCRIRTRETQVFLALAETSFPSFLAAARAALRSFGPPFLTRAAHWASVLPVFAFGLRSIASIMSRGVIGMPVIVSWTTGPPS